MFEIKKVKNYVQFARLLEEKTECSVTIDVIEKDGAHVHYELSEKHGMPIGVLCIDHGVATFAPFASFKTVSNSQYINICHLVQIEDFAKVLKVFSEIFVEDVEE